MRIGTTELLLLLALALLIFGGGKLAGLGKALGSSIRDFKKEVSGLSDDESEETVKTDKEKEDHTDA